MSLSAFHSLSLVGKGTSGTVWKGTRRSDHQQYAIKQLNIRHMTQREREEVVNEVRLLASIVHRNIIRYCEAFVEDDCLFIVTELATKGELASRIKQQPMAEDQIWSVFIQICVGVKFLHDRNILHRDLKPQNIFLTEKNGVKIGDLGCSKLLKHGAMCRTQIGTPYFMSPELWQNKPYGAKSDVWSIGSILYQMITTQPPFDARNVRELSNRVIYGPCPRISAKWSEDLRNLVSQLLVKDPVKRPAVAEILALPQVQRRMHLVQDALLQDQEHEFNLLETIKIPPNLKRLQNQLPRSSYATNKVKPAAKDRLTVELPEDAQKENRNPTSSVHAPSSSPLLLPSLVPSPPVAVHRSPSQPVASGLPPMLPAVSPAHYVAGSRVARASSGLKGARKYRQLRLSEPAFPPAAAVPVVYPAHRREPSAARLKEDLVTGKEEARVQHGDAGSREPLLPALPARAGAPHKEALAAWQEQAKMGAAVVPVQPLRPRGASRGAVLPELGAGAAKLPARRELSPDMVSPPPFPLLAVVPGTAIAQRLPHKHSEAPAANMYAVPSAAPRPAPPVNVLPMRMHRYGYHQQYRPTQLW